MRKLLSWQHWRAWHADAAALAGLALFFVAFFPQAVFGGKYLIANDAFYYSYPLRTVAADMLWHGQLPLWTPYVMSGYPLLSMAQLGLGYPLTWCYLLLPGHVAEQIYVLTPFLLVPGFTYAYLRELGRTPLAALLGALTFGYGGLMASPLANNGFLPNAIMWLPLLLIALERARHRRFVPCLLLGACAYTMSVLTGIGQGFLYVGLVALAYALFLVCVPADAEKRGGLRARLAAGRQWRPLFVAVGALLAGAGVGAFQILETARMARRSVRSALSYEIFTQGSFAPATLVKSFVAPLFYVSDMHAAVPPLAVALTLFAVYSYARRDARPASDPRVLFYGALAVVALVLMLGEHTPLYRLVFHIPLLNRFRVPSRHTFEWTFAVGILAAYGWDAAARVLRQRRATQTHSPARTLFAALVLLVMGGAVGALWWVKMQGMPSPASAGTPTTGVYCAWKGAFVLLLAGALWRASMIPHARTRFALLLAAVLTLCYVEPSALIRHWWGGQGLTADRFAFMTEGTRFLQQFPPTENRHYTRVDLFLEQFGGLFGEPPRFDAANYSAVFGTHNLAGYEPLLLDRYSRALGGVSLDTVRTADNQLDRTLFTERSHVLDMLNTTHAVSYSFLSPRPLSVLQALGTTGFDDADEVLPQTTRTWRTTLVEASGVELITTLANSELEPDGAMIAQVRLHTTDGRIIEHELKAGRDSAEWAHERADVLPLVRHQLAHIYDSKPARDDAGNFFPIYRYRTYFAFAAPTQVLGLEIVNVARTARLIIHGARLRIAPKPFLAPLRATYPEKWQPAYDQHGLLILRNTHACPRAWLVAEAEAVEGEEALRRIRGESAEEFDPRRTALLEVKPGELPPLPGGALTADSGARVTSYAPNQLTIETNAPTATVLVVSEIFYPGWEVTIDGQPGRIDVANYLLRAVTLPAGPHTVEMHYAAPAARNGAIISALTLCLLAGLAIYTLRTRTKRATLRGHEAART